MQATIGCLIGLFFVVSVWAEPLLEGRVRLESGEPVADAQVRIFDLTDLRQGPLVRAQTDGTGYFALPLAALAGSVVPERFALGPNYPNPFNPSTVIPYQLTASSAVRLEVFNLLGQHLATLVDGERAAGFHTATWQATDAAGRAVGAGVYIYRMTVGVESQTGRMVLIDGQAGLASGGSASVWSGASGGGSAGEGSQVYGLLVSGSGLVPYVDSAFRVASGMAPVELVVSAGPYSAGKATDDDCALCGLLGASNDQPEEEDDETQEEEGTEDDETPEEEDETPEEEDETPEEEGTDGQVTIPDANLRAAIEAALDKTSGAPITEAELKALTLLEATNRDIRNLTGLEAATNLTELDLRFNKIEDITPLASLTNLTWLDLNFNAIEDISPLAGLTNLTILRLGWNKIEDITPLAGLTNLTELTLGFNNITDKSVLANLTNLTFLNLQYSDITDISMLAGLTNLRRLLLYSNGIEDISPLAGLTNLTLLALANNAIEDITPLAGLTNLTELTLEGNYITDIMPLADLTDLTSLELNKNNITDVSPLAGLTNLTWLDLRFNTIEDMSPLAGLTNLTWLGLRGNPLNLSSIDDHIPVLEDRGATVQYDSFQEEGDYDIELVFLDSFPERDRRLLHWAARRWMAVIREDLPDYEFAQGWSGPCGDHSIEIPSGERIDDLRIYVISIEDGPLGWGGPDLLRETTHLPVVGCMAFDIARSNIPIIGLHEIGHVLGFGTIWDELGFFQNPPNGDQHFNGPLAIAAFDDAGGREYTGAKVPVSGGHWRESVFGQELMTYGGDLSAITIQSLADLGYAVDVTQADPYTLPGAAGKASAKVSAALPSTFGDDPLRGRLESAEWTGGRGFDFARRDNRLMGRLAPHPHTERKPMYVINPQGYIIRTLGH